MAFCPQLEVALGILASQARGPMYEKYVRQLEETCERIWQDGRIGCETLSLTGKNCHHPEHLTARDPERSVGVSNFLFLLWPLGISNHLYKTMF